MGHRLVRVGSALAAAALIFTTAAPAAVAESSVTSTGVRSDAAAQQVVFAARKDYCSPGDPNSVTVVVDFSGVGGGVDIRCAAVSSGATGAQALAAAGFSTAGTVHDGPGFVCRIDGEPASDPCVDTPKPSYWAYHQAAPGGGWTYSSRGFTSSRVKPGGFEGWSYGSGGAPGVAPVLPAAPEPEPAPEPTPEQPADQPAEQPAAPEQEAAAAPEANSGNDAAGQAPAADPGATTQQDDAAAQAAIDAAAAQAAAAESAAAESAAAASAAAESAAAQAAAAAAQASADAAAALAAQSTAASSDPSSAASTGRSPTAGSTTSSGASTTLSAEEPTSGSTLWIMIAALVATAGLGGVAFAVSRRRAAHADQAD